MNTTDLAQLLRSLATTPSRRGVTRSLAGLVLGGALSSLLGAGNLDAKRRKKKRRRRRKKKQEQSQPFCAGRDYCVVDDVEQVRCDDGSSAENPCYCHMIAETGDSSCVVPGGIAACSECTGEIVCIDLAACGYTTACALSCPNPL